MIGSGYGTMASACSKGDSDDTATTRPAWRHWRTAWPPALDRHLRGPTPGADPAADARYPSPGAAHHPGPAAGQADHRGPAALPGRAGAGGADAGARRPGR